MKRRGFVKSLGALGSMTALDMLINSMVSGASNQAIAQAIGAEPRKYIMLFLGGAPSRWMFDLFLNPGNANNFNRNPAVGTHFNGNAANLQYGQVNIGGNFVPFMWQHDVAAPNNGQVALASLLNNMISIRGIVMPSDGHTENVNRHFRPEPGAPSTTGLIADHTTAPIPALSNRYATDAFRSGKGRTLTSIQTELGHNSIAELLAPFEYSLNDTFKTKKELMEEAVERSVAAIQLMNSQNGLGVNSIYSDRNSAKALIKRTFGNLDQIWDSLVAKYSDLITRSALPTGGVYPNGIPGISDRAIPIEQNPANRGGRYLANGPAVFNQDLRTIVDANTYWEDLVEGLAMAEFVMTQKLAGSVTIGTRRARDLNIQTTAGGAFSRERMVFDHHGADASVAQFIHTMMYRGIGASLIELMNVLKAQNLFNDTIVELASEFNRSPRQTMTGSDHAFRGANTSIWSGAFPSGLQIVGNIQQNSPEPDYAGTWGAAAPTFPDGEPMKIADVCHTKASLLKAPGLVTNNGKLFINAQGQVAAGLTAEIVDV